MYLLLCCDELQLRVSSFFFFFSSRRRHTSCALVTGVQTCALPICSKDAFALPDSMTEVDALAKIRAIADRNQVFRSFIGQGYYGTHVANVILRDRKRVG